MLKLSLHPGGLAPRIVNLAQWRCHLFARLRQQVEVSGDPVLVDLLEELAAYPQQTPAAPPGDTRAIEPAVCVPLQLAGPQGTLSFLGTTTVFGTPVDITLSEFALETVFPADEATAQALRRMAATPGSVNPDPQRPTTEKTSACSRSQRSPRSPPIRRGWKLLAK